MLLNMLETSKSNFKNEKVLVLLVDELAKKKSCKKGSKKKKKMNPKASISKKKMAKNIVTNVTYFYCRKDGH